jgi:hypothetical protein
MDAAGSSSAACFADGSCAEAILMAATHPERIHRLVLVNSHRAGHAGSGLPVWDPRTPGHLLP